MNVYNIVWADDEIDVFLDEDYENDLLNMGFRIIGKAHNGEELEEQLKKKDEIDAVIVDANFNESVSMTNNERDISGLSFARGLYLHKLNKSLPFFLYTNRSDELLNEITKDNPSFLKDFPRYERWFSKNSVEEHDKMFEAIKNEVEKRNTPQFRIRNKYSREFEAASLIEGAPELLMNSLTLDFCDDNWKDVRYFFNPVRKIIESIFDDLRNGNKKKLPPIKSLNIMCKFLLNAEYDDEECHYKQNAVLMHNVLARSLKFCVEIIQDGSHCGSNLNLGVDEYARNTMNAHLFNSIIFIVMDLLLWYADLLKSKKSPKELWEGYIKYEMIGKVHKSFNNSYWYVDKYELQSSSDLKDGVEIIIKKSNPNKRPRNGLVRYVFKDDYVIKKD